VGAKTAVTVFVIALATITLLNKTGLAAKVTG
jgi:hypothetical protein